MAFKIFRNNHPQPKIKRRSYKKERILYFLLQMNISFKASTLEQDCNHILDSLTVKLIKTLAYSVLLIFSLVGNGLIIAVIRRNKQLRTIINFFVLNMAISDLLLPIFALPRRLQDIYYPERLWMVDGIFGAVTCKMLPFAEAMSITVSVTTLVIISIERFFSIVFPMRRQPISGKKACYIAIVFTWFTGSLYPATYFYKYRLVRKDTSPYCQATWEPLLKGHKVQLIEFFCFLVLYTILPSILLISLYSAIIVSLQRQKSPDHFASQERVRHRRSRQYSRITYMLVTATILFLVAWIPFNFALFAFNPERPCDSRHLIFGAHFLTYTYSAVNPVIYCIFNKRYRKGFLELLCCPARGRSWLKNRSIWIKFRSNNCHVIDEPQQTTNSVVVLSIQSLQTHM